MGYNATPPTLPLWTQVPLWAAAVVLLGLMLWGVYEVTRSEDFGLLGKLALIVLVIVVPFIGPIASIVMVRAVARVRHT